MADNEDDSETITFELVRRVQREEQRIPKLTKLPDGFYKSVDAYLERKRGASNRKVALEAKNVERLVEDIFNRRERKIFNLAIISARTNIPPENLTKEEKEFFDQVLHLIKTRRQEVLSRILEQQEAEEKTNLVVFKQEVPEFVGSDMKNYGPFDKGDIANLPEDNKKVLMEKGAVEEFEINK